MNVSAYLYKLSKALSFAPPKIRALFPRQSSKIRALFSRQSSKINQKLWLLVGFVFLMITASTFFWQNNQVISKIYQLQHLQERLTGLKKENRSLETSAINENSLSNLEELVNGLGLEKVQSIIFIQSLENSVVAR